MGMGQIVDYSQFILQIEKAIANGVASLDSNAKVPKNQISLNASDVGAIAVEADPTVSIFTKSLTSNNTILTALNAASGTISASVLPSYVDDVLNFANLAAFPVAGETGKIYVTEDTNKTYRWSGTVYVEISSSATAGEALKLTNARTISTTGDATYSVSFDGSANVTSAITLATVNSNAGSFGSASSIPAITVNAKGQVTAVSTNSIGNELIALQSLSDTPGFLKKTGDGTYSIDIDSYLSLAGGNVTGNLGLGVVSPTVKLSIGRLGGAFTVPTLNAHTALLLTAGGGTVASGSIISVLGGNTSQVGVVFGDTDASEQGGVYYANSTDTLSLRAGNSVRISVDSTSTTFSSAAESTSTTTGAIRGASLGITGAIFAGTVSANSYNLIPIWRGGGNISTNTVVGMNAGLSNTTGNNNSFVGMNAGLFNTTGNNNSFVGVNAGYSNTTGNNNSFVGVHAGLSNTTGNNNSFVGVNAGYSNTTGNNNSFVGMNAGLFNTTGIQNSFVGVNAGRYTSDGVTDLTISNNSCFFGMNTKGTQNATNENVFGFNATGNGSNTVTIGDFNITNTYLRGVISTNSTTPSTSPTTGASVIPGGQGIGGNQYVGGFSSLGGDANHPGIKIKVLTGTTAATEGGVASIAHGLTVSKIVSVTVLVNQSENAFVLSGYSTQFVGHHFSVALSIANIQIINHPTDSENILLKPVKITVIYTA